MQLIGYVVVEAALVEPGGELNVLDPAIYEDRIDAEGVAAAYGPGWGIVGICEVD